jgi:spore coat protein H
MSAAVPEPALQPPAAVIDKQAPGSKLPLYELKMDTRSLAQLDFNGFSNDTVPATFTAGGKVYEGVRVRTRGAWSRSWPKKSLKILFGPDNPFDEHQSLNLNSGWRDPAFIREVLAYHVYSQCGAPASASRLIRLDVNGQFRGIYVEVEQPGKGFLHRQKLKGASVFKAISRSNQADERDLGSDQAYQAGYGKETQKQGGLGELQKFCRELQRTPKAADFFNRYVDVDKYINYLVGTVLTQNWDSFNKNHFLVYDERGSQKWFVLPWDLDRTFGDYWDWSFNQSRLSILLGTRQSPGVTGWNRLEDRFFSDPNLTARFVDRLAAVLEKEFTNEKLFPFIDRLESDMASEAQADRRRWRGSDPDFHGGIAQVKRYIEQRRAYLLRELPALRRTRAAAPDLATHLEQ